VKPYVKTNKNDVAEAYEALIVPARNGALRFHRAVCRAKVQRVLMILDAI
jgi:hypothetical protein